MQESSPNFRYSKQWLIIFWEWGYGSQDIEIENFVYFRIQFFTCQDKPVTLVEYARSPVDACDYHQRSNHLQPKAGTDHSLPRAITLVDPMPQNSGQFFIIRGVLDAVHSSVDE
ncbi:uncharacterized protein PGTG_16877 [Puccinia graminis f. sp. tritici CRL 75-36-700-3]|uniref:Uncharacterized protein n=1 Tax=Puccinia graminis f. sp. tritici (strain CRL 75-36-700-3 / race SCCL) TaxID=418459 RepID=E3L3K7_PUCGT|nr:uncharacterized protein PGTG_16877 [Puccinia graminis f. sp. tritici CRL 75-36-700-3]EFP91132.1 hypothetical protein PGTG_16877 [Puccinia graminis f. sp. tritici CRL 75-36-700-3]